MVAVVNFLIFVGVMSLLFLAGRGIYRRVKPEGSTPAESLGRKVGERRQR